MNNNGKTPDHPAFDGDRKREAAASEREHMEQPIRREALAVQGVLFLLVLLLWPLPIINPVKLLVVLIHEISHVAAAYATGGVVFGIVIDPGGAGATLGMDGLPVAIALAGYAGSLAFGVLLYYLVARWDPFEVWIVLLVLTGLSIGLGWMDQFSLFFGVGTIAAIVIVMAAFSAHWKLFMLRWIATTCCLYPIIDVLGELWKRDLGLRVNGKEVGSDVAVLAGMTGMPSWAIGTFWVLLGILVVGCMALWSAKTEARNEVRMSMKQKFRPRDYAQALYYGDKFNPPRYEIK